MQAAVEILAALNHVHRGGEGGWLDVSMTDGAFRWLTLVFAEHMAGPPPVRRGDQRLAGRYACYRVYECKDARFFSVAALEPKFWSTLCEALGRPDLIEAQYSTSPEVQRAVELIFEAKTRGEWEAILSNLDVCCEPVLDLDEVPAHPQIAARRLFERARRGRAPGLGEHNDEILREIRIEGAT